MLLLDGSAPFLWEGPEQIEATSLPFIVAAHKRIPSQITVSVDADTIGVSTRDQNPLG